MNTRKRTRILALVGLLALLVVGSTYAYWTKTSNIENPFDTNSFGSTIVENFNPADGEGWQPGSTVTKVVTAKNTGNTPLVVRANLEETWTRKGEAAAYITRKPEAAAEAASPVYSYYQQDVTDGLTAADRSVVNKTFNTANWTYNEKDGWWYYNELLPGGKSSAAWLEAVQLSPDADMGKMEQVKYVSIHPTTEPDAINGAPVADYWIRYDNVGQSSMPKYIDTAASGADRLKYTKKAADGSAIPGSDAWMPVLQNKSDQVYQQDPSGTKLSGYSGSNYILKVTVETVQATKEALQATVNDTAAYALIPAGVTQGLT